MKRFSGFTLIEVLVVMTLMGILTVSSITLFFNYAKTQAFQKGVSDVAASLNKAKARAVSQVKPAACGAVALEGYEFSHSPLGNTFLLRARCGGIYHLIETKTLPSGVTFAAGSAGTVFFKVSSGIVAANANIILSGNGTTKTITVNTVGTISVP